MRTLLAILVWTSCGVVAAAPEPVALSETDWARADDPASDGWRSEVLAALIDEQLHHLGDIIIADEDADPTALASDTVAGDLLRPELTTVHTGQFRVERAAGRQQHFTGAAAFAKTVSQLRQALHACHDKRYKFKVVRVRIDGSVCATREFVHFSGSGERTHEINAVWETSWQLQPADAPPRLLSVAVHDHEEVSSQSAPGFQDLTTAVLAGNRSWQEQLLFGFNHWLQRRAENRGAILIAAHGLAVADVNGDGRDDIYLCQESGLPNRLYLQQADGSAVDASATAGLDWLEDTRGALFIDLDNDGDADLAASVRGGVAIAENDGSGRFTLHEVVTTDDDPMSLAAADVDGDGDLDLYVCVYYPPSVAGQAVGLGGAAATQTYHDATNGGRNVLLRNDGGWHFADLTESAGLTAYRQRYSFAAAFADYDDDGDQDLYVANDYGADNLYRNDLIPSGTARFTYVANAAGAHPGANGMSVSWADFDRDGDFDLHLGNMFSAAGGRVTNSPAFKPDGDPQLKDRLRRFAVGNALLQNDGKGHFDDVSEAAGIQLGRWAWSCQAADLDNDGWQDLVVGNGFVTASNSGDL